MKTVLIEVSDEFIAQAIKEDKDKSEAEVLSWLKQYLEEMLKIFPEAWAVGKATGKLDIKTLTETVRGNIAQHKKKEAKP